MRLATVIKGYVYAPDCQDGPMTGARTGVTIRKSRHGPPWIVVDHDVFSVVVARWPGRLWRVQVIEPAPDEDQPLGPPKLPLRYTRAEAVQVEEELPVSFLFGPHGAAVCAIIDAAKTLSVEQAAALSSTRHPKAGQAYSRIWKAWLKDRGSSQADAQDDHEGTLALGAYPPTSPVNSGLAVMANELHRRAVSLCGDAATVTDWEETWLARPWSGAQAALLDAALALGAPDFTSTADREILTHAWRTVPEH
jgi:hypothetical protein